MTCNVVQVREALRFIDADGSGTIDREEIKEMLKRRNKPKPSAGAWPHPKGPTAPRPRGPTALGPLVRTLRLQWLRRLRLSPRAVASGLRLCHGHRPVWFASRSLPGSLAARSPLAPRSLPACSPP